MKVGIFYTDVNLESRLRYVLDFIEHHPLNLKKTSFSVNQEEEINISYEKNNNANRDFFIPKQEKLFSSKERFSFSNNLYKQSDKLLHSVESVIKESDQFFNAGYFGFDILESIFFHLSRVEELDLKRDQLNDRGQIKESDILVVKNKIEKIPHVDIIVESFLETLTEQPIQKTTGVTVTHDIDFIEKYKSPLSFLNITAKSILKTQKIKPIVDQYLKTRRDKTNDPYNTFLELLRKEKSVSKKIYFLVGGKHKFDNTYSLSHPTFLEAIKLSIKRGYDIGIHPSYDSWKSEELVIAEKKKLETAIGKEISISRQHYLHFDIEETPSVLLKAGIREDSSIGFTERIGFRCGTGFPYFLYDFKKEQKSALLELPLVYMDSAAINESKETTTPLEEMTKGFLLTNTHNTHLCFNFHNSRMDESLAEGRLIKKIYTDLFS